MNRINVTFVPKMLKDIFHNMNQTFWEKMRRVKFADLFHIFLFLSAIPFALIFRCRRKHLWLICEYGHEARDNAFYLYKYLRQNCPDIDAVYAIKKKSKDYNKLNALGETIEYGSWRHWVYYLAAEVNISTQKGGKPNAAICYALEISGLLKNQRVFLQHGVTKDDLPFLYYKNTKMRLFVCAAQPEYQFICNTFGYPKGHVQYLGFCRFDALHHCMVNKHLLLIAPTWRQGLYSLHRPSSERHQNFKVSDYCLYWNDLLNDTEFHQLLHKYQIQVIFCPHRNMQMFFEDFFCSDSSITITRWETTDITAIIHSAAMVITDFSSIFMDFAYMKRPVLYYQFDYENFRKEHLPEGYFNYQTDGFGPVCHTKKDLVKELENILRNDLKMAPCYLKRQQSFFPLYDDKNCERTYKAIKQILN